MEVKKALTIFLKKETLIYEKTYTLQIPAPNNGIRLDGHGLLKRYLCHHDRNRWKHPAAIRI